MIILSIHTKVRDQTIGTKNITEMQTNISPRTPETMVRKIHFKISTEDENIFLLSGGAGPFFFILLVGFIWAIAYCIKFMHKDIARAEWDRNVELLVSQQRTRIAIRETQNRPELLDQYWRSDRPSDHALVHMNRAANSDRIYHEIGMRLADETPITSPLNVSDLPTYNEIQQQNRSATEESPPCYEECLINIVLAEEMNNR